MFSLRVSAFLVSQVSCSLVRFSQVWFSIVSRSLLGESLISLSLVRFFRCVSIFSTYLGQLVVGGWIFRKVVLKRVLETFLLNNWNKTGKKHNFWESALTTPQAYAKSILILPILHCRENVGFSGKCQIAGIVAKSKKWSTDSVFGPKKLAPKMGDLRCFQIRDNTAYKPLKLIFQEN